MVFDIYYINKECILFNVNFYISNLDWFGKDDEYTQNRYFLDIRNTNYISNAAAFIVDNIDQYNHDDFVEDCKKIENLYEWLNGENSNHINNYETANKLRNDLLPKLREMIYSFAKKWGLEVSEK